MHDVLNIMHQDIKPENLLVDANDDIKITDFGTATLIENGETDLVTNYDWGTRLYLPPEAWLSRLSLIRDRNAWQTSRCLGFRMHILQDAVRKASFRNDLFE